jgi:O-acetyl-ADP-ribose deacetylase (regulator of RNase III)
VGEAVITGAGKLKAKYIIHGALTEFDGFIQEENIAKTLLSCLRLANRRRLKSLAIPDLSTGIVRFEPERCAEILFTALKQFVKKENRSLRLIEIVLWDIETLRIYKTLYKMIFSQDV